MQFKKEKRSVEFIFGTGCNKDFTLQEIYDPKAKKYFGVSEKSLKEKFEYALQYGSDTDHFHMLVETNPTAKKLWQDLQKTLKPKFKEGDLVVFSREQGNSAFSLKSPIWIAGPIKEWKRTCGYPNYEEKFICSRHFTRVDGIEKNVMDENDAVAVQEINDLKVANAIINKIKRQFIEAGIKNATLNYMGKAYKI